MFRWWTRRRHEEDELEMTADEWIARHGPYARRLARIRSMDAYLMGNLEEQEHWGRIRELIDERIGNDSFSTPKSRFSRRPPE